MTKVCLYNSTNFLNYLGAFAADNLNWNGSAAKNADTSAYNAGSATWDVKVFEKDNWGGGYYCLKPGRGWIDLGAFAGTNNNGQSNDWVVNFCT